MCMHVCAAVWFCVYGWFARMLSTQSQVLSYTWRTRLSEKRREGLVGESSSERDRLEMHTINSKKNIKI